MKRSTARGVIAFAAFATTAGVQPASAQNFFEMLFGGARFEGRSAYQQDDSRQNSLPGYGRQGGASNGRQGNAGYGRQGNAGNGTLDPSDPRLHRAIIRHRAAAKPAARKVNLVSEGTSSPAKQAAVVATADAPRGSIPFFLKDKTLRAGDVVVTEKGFLVYQGGEHTSRAFVAINSSGSRKGDRSNLLALEQASTMRTPNLTVELTPSIRDFVGPRLPEQMDERFTAALATKTASR